ncbi:hypothetical protein LLS1_35030 [Leifsonia sp. LS1]|nr:hypothetical protein LLS1_35030 [Leifsonia sp. LS1]
MPPMIMAVRVVSDMRPPYAGLPARGRVDGADLLSADDAAQTVQRRMVRASATYSRALASGR